MARLWAPAFQPDVFPKMHLGLLPETLHQTIPLSAGYVYPPFMVLERGTTLTEWMKTPRAFPGILGLMHDVATHIAMLHETGHCHRDLKPDNVLLMMQSQVWKLIDFGIAAPIGAPPCCSRTLWCT
jgi:serine/threonine protein kinase